jgi:hypothetical protein
MQLCDVFLRAGEGNFQALLKTVSMGKLRTYQLFERVKAWAHLGKLNSENLRKAAPRLWSRISAGEDEVASDVAQAVLVSNLDMITVVLNFLEIPHEEGFFAKGADVSKYLTEGWQQRVFEKFRDTHPHPVLVFYINHLGWETKKDEATFFEPVAAS